MANDPAFLLYSKDWLQGTAEMSAEERGVYIDLLAHQHQDNGLPTDTKRLARMARVSHDEFLRVWEFLSKKFLCEDGKLFNKKLQKVIEGRSEHGDMRRIIGTFGKILKDTEMPENLRKEIRKSFCWQSYIQAKDKQNLSKTISSWVSEIVANAQPNTKANIGNGTEDGNGIENVFNNTVKNNKELNGNSAKGFKTKPSEQECNLELPQQYIKKAIEYLDRNKQIKKSEGQISVMWEMFKLENFTGKNFYEDASSVYTHFLRTLKHEKPNAMSAILNSNNHTRNKF